MLVFPINTLKVKYVQWHIELSIQRMNIEIKKKKGHKHSTSKTTTCSTHTTANARITQVTTCPVENRIRILRKFLFIRLVPQSITTCYRRGETFEWLLPASELESSESKCETETCLLSDGWAQWKESRSPSGNSREQVPRIRWQALQDEGGSAATEGRGTTAPPPRIFPAEKRQWDPRGQLSTKLEMHHLGATQLRRQLGSSGAPHCPNSAQTRDSDSQREGGRSVQEADAGLHLHPEPAACDTPKGGCLVSG